MSKETLVKMAKEKSNLGTAAKVGAGGALAAGGVFGGTNALVQRLKKD